MSAGPSLDGILARCEELYEDKRLSVVSRWKEDNPGRMAVGHLPVYSPRPLFEALGCLPVALFGGGDSVDIIKGDSYFQSYICHLPRSVIELGLSGGYDALEAMVFPSICDVVRNLGGMWQLLFPERYSAYLDLPQDFDPALGGRFYAADLRRIAGELEARGAQPLTETTMRRAIMDEDDRRLAIEDLDALRAEAPWLAPASEAYLVVRAGGLMMAAEHAELVNDYVRVAKERTARRYDNVRVVVAGAFCEQPPLNLIRTLERCGCDIVADDFQLGMRTVPGQIDVAPGEDPLDSLARAYVERGVESAYRYDEEGDRGRELVEQVERTRAEGVVFAAPSFCDPALLDRPMQESALDAAGIPHTGFKYAENTGQFQVIREQAGAFSDSVKLWGVA